MQQVTRKDGSPFATLPAAKREARKYSGGRVVCLGDNSYVVEIDSDENPRRPKRIPLRERNVLTIEEKFKHPDYEYRIVNEKLGTMHNRIQIFQEAGWTLVQNTEQLIEVGDESVKRESQKGSNVSKVVGLDKKGSPITGYLMKIPKEIYDEEQAVKERQLVESEQNMKRSEESQEGRYGSAKFGRPY